ncbi:MAG: ribbon-helix-helix protein, CopG family [Anaerolineae bacterium]|nr:ribbon-helix-helix protein, CopG family [Anaerolineae bacterium]
MKRSRRFGLVLSPKEKNAVALLAKSRGGLSQSALIRCLIHEAIQSANFSTDKLTQINSKNE